VEETIVYNEINTYINNAINALPPKCLMVYKLIKEEGFSYKQTAEILDLSVNTIEGHMQNALQKISSYLRRLGLDI
jgi:DNA-directed RNA polymerase specialized sigma subunit, sigma24 homolog